MKRHYLITVVFGVLFFNSVVMSNPKIVEKNMSAVINQDCDFNSLNLSVPSGKTLCSPIVTEKQILEGITGIFINMPRKMQLKDSKEIKVCLLSILEGEDAAKYGGAELLVLKNETTNKVYNGRFIDNDRIAPIEEAKASEAEEDLDMIQEGYFNFNLNTYLDFDRTPGLYHFYIVMGPFKSNVLTFEIVEDK